MKKKNKEMANKKKKVRHVIHYLNKLSNYQAKQETQLKDFDTLYRFKRLSKIKSTDTFFETKPKIKNRFMTPTYTSQLKISRPITPSFNKFKSVFDNGIKKKKKLKVSKMYGALPHIKYLRMKNNVIQMKEIEKDIDTNIKHNPIYKRFRVEDKKKLN
ncbi:MAG: hypothetical protein MJ252_14495, partial [archaeon]|nr:hypothetical protein [archaeon]